MKEAPGAKIFPCDLSTLKGVRAMVEAFKEQYGRLDVLINNVGAIFPERIITSDGYEKTFALNHLAYFATTLLLTNELKAADSASVINIGSSHYRAGKIHFDDLHFEHGYNMNKAYCQTKLANSLFTFEFDRRYRQFDIFMVVVHPGAVDSGFGNPLTGFWRFMWKISKPLRRTSQTAAREIFEMLQTSQPQQHPGMYFSGGKPQKQLPKATDDEAAKKLWKQSLQLCGLIEDF